MNRLAALKSKMRNERIYYKIDNLIGSTPLLSATLQKLCNIPQLMKPRFLSYACMLGIFLYNILVFFV